MTELQKIDKILRLVVECEQPPKRTQAEIAKELDFQLSTKELIEILDKLTKDGFVIREIQQDDIANYFSSFEGRLFLKLNGYNSQYKSKKWKSIFDKSMVVLTIINIIAVLILTFLSYRATEKANDNKNEVDKLNAKIIKLTGANEMLPTNLKK